MVMVLFPMMSGPRHLDTGKSRELSKDVDELRRLAPGQSEADALFTQGFTVNS